MTEYTKASDLLQVVRDALKDGGLGDVFDSLPDGRRYPECTVLSYGLPSTRQVDYAGTEQTQQSVTVIVKRLTDPKAQVDAMAARCILTAADLSSRNGSYDYVGIDAEKPRPLEWNESGRYVWAFDSTITTQRKEF